MKQCCGFLDDDRCMLLDGGIAAAVALQILVKISRHFYTNLQAKRNLATTTKTMTMIIIKVLSSASAG